MFIKTIKPLNQYENKKKSRSLFLGLLLAIFFIIFDISFFQFFFLLHITAYQCPRLIIAINIKGIAKYKPSAIYKKSRNHYLIFMCLFTSFTVQDYKIIFNSKPRVLRTHCNFGSKMAHLPQPKAINLNFMYFLVHFMWLN